MKKLLVLFICVAILLGGCGIMQTAEQRNRRLTLSRNLQMRGLVDDFDHAMLLDRPCWMTEYHIECGF